MNDINILTFGADLDASNMGCMALGRSFLNICEKIAQKNGWNFKVIMLSEKKVHYSSQWVKVDTIVGHFKKIGFYKQLNNYIKKADVVIDFTLGDSFTDIYGLRRFITGTIPKYMTVFRKKKLIMGPQTIGPFNNWILRNIAKNIIKKVNCVFCRDKISSLYAENVLKKKNKLTTDIAFSLRADLNYLNKYEFSSRKKIGINVSALLWNLGSNKSDHIHLRLNYKEYIKKLIEFCLKNDFEVHLISHVIYQQGGEADDYTSAMILKRMYGDVILAPQFLNPMQAKGYISQMSCFVGARMHATIGAVSMKIPTIPIAYSRKFIGLYQLLDYQHVIDATKTSTEKALEMTFREINSLECLRDQVIKSAETAKEMNKEFILELEKILHDEVSHF